MILTALEYGIGGGAIVVGLGAIELAKTVVNRRNGKNGRERRVNSFGEGDRMLVTQTHAKTETIKGEIRELGSTLKDMTHTLDSSLEAQNRTTDAVNNLANEIRQWRL